jgi:hypothetical protein
MFFARRGTRLHHAITTTGNQKGHGFSRAIIAARKRASALPKAQAKSRRDEAPELPSFDAATPANLA